MRFLCVKMKQKAQKRAHKAKVNSQKGQELLETMATKNADNGILYSMVDRRPKRSRVNCNENYLCAGQMKLISVS